LDKRLNQFKNDVQVWQGLTQNQGISNGNVIGNLYSTTSSETHPSPFVVKFIQGQLLYFILVNSIMNNY